jgi:membrane-associated phospholipid phosphatase
MSVVRGGKPAATAPAAPWSRWFIGNCVTWLGLLGRAPRSPSGRGARSVQGAVVLVLGMLLVLAIVVAAMLVLDRATAVAAQSLPVWLVDTFNELTDFGRAGWLLVPIAFILLAVAALAAPALPRMTHLVLAALAVRLGFVFAAISVPGLVVTIVKRLIGRARPFVGGAADPFLYLPFGWRPDYASLPSGHTTNVFAALIAVSLVWPRLRAIMLAYALIIAASRVIILAHYPSDVVAGAVVGVVGALLVRDWFAARRLGFVVGADGRVQALPGPSPARITKSVRGLIAS